MSQQVSNSGHSIKGFGRFDYIKIAILGFALTASWSSLQSIILPIKLLEFVADSEKNTYLGLLTFAALILAMLTQPIFGTISDRSGFRWGRRRPYILLGIILAIPLLFGTGLAGSLAILFLACCLLQISSNIAQSPYQAFIPDLVPDNKRGLASGVKSLMEVLGGIALIRAIAYLMGRYFDGEGISWLWMALGVLAAVLLSAMVATVLTVKERPGIAAPRLHLLATIYKSFKINIPANRDFILFLIARGVMGMPGIMLQIFAFYYLMDVVGIANPASVAADLVIVIGVCLLITVYIAGRMSDRTGRKPILIAAGLLGALGIVLLFFSRSYLHIMSCGVILGIANGALLSSSWALATDLVARGEEARYLGLTNVAIAGGSALARLVGPVIDFFNNMNSGMGYQAMLLICIACFIIGTLLITRIKRP